MPDESISIVLPGVSYHKAARVSRAFLHLLELREDEAWPRTPRAVTTSEHLCDTPADLTSSRALLGVPAHCLSMMWCIGLPPPHHRGHVTIAARNGGIRHGGSRVRLACTHMPVVVGRYVMRMWALSGRDTIELDKDSFPLVEASVPQQGNATDCGLYTLLYAKVGVGTLAFALASAPVGGGWRVGDGDAASESATRDPAGNRLRGGVSAASGPCFVVAPGGDSSGVAT